MKKIEYIIFVCICFILCVIPFAGMSVAKTDTTSENRTLASLPEWEKEGKWNQDYFTELGQYFEDHFAFRNLFVAADSMIQSNVFQVSNIDTVIKGENGWLYYNATLSDYKGDNLMSERAVFNAANNMSMIQQYVEAQGGSFLLTVAPNKNTLYPENMPYYVEKKVSEKKNIDALEAALEEQNVSYADLFEVFEAEEDIYYMKKDSHWNNQGAVMAYNKIMNTRVMEKHLVLAGQTLDDIIKTYNTDIDNIEDFRKVIYIENKDVVTKDYQVNYGEYILVPSENLISKN